MYYKIIIPKTSRKVNINSKIGKAILMKFTKEQIREVNIKSNSYWNTNPNIKSNSNSYWNTNPNIKSNSKSNSLLL